MRRSPRPFIRNLRLAALLPLLVGPNVFGNVVGTDAQNFHPTTNGLDFVTVQSSETLRPGVVNLGLFFNGAWNALPRFQGQPEYGDRLFGMDLSFGMGLADRWDIGIGIPSVLDQRVSAQSGFRGDYSKNGLTEVKLNSKYRLVGDDSGGTALVGSANFNLIENNPYAGAGAGPTYNLEAVFDRTFGVVAAAINVGYRFRRPGSSISGIPIRPFGNQYIASVAGNYPISSWNSKLILEVFGSAPVNSTSDDVDRQASSLEALLGIKHDFTTNLAGHFGMGRELITGLASPSFRIYTGVHFQFGPVFASAEKIEPVLTAAAEEDEVEETFILRNIPFAFNSSELSTKARPILDELAKYLREDGFRLLTIEGHTDWIGKDEYNLRLSQQRADAIRNDLIKSYQFAADKIGATGFGEARPIADNGNYQGREANRRVEFKVKRPRKGNVDMPGKRAAPDGTN